MLKKLASSALRKVIYLFRTFVSKFPAQPIVVVYGFPDSEENSLVAASTFAGRVRHPVYLLCSNVDRTRKHLELLVSDLPGAREIRLICKSTLKAVWLSAFARVLLFTHGLFGNSAPGPFRLYVNLWHGHGPKKAFSSSRQVSIPSDLIIGNTEAYAGQTTNSLGLLPSSLIRIGNVRQDLMVQPPSAQALEALGLSERQPYVMWMPTFRQVHQGMLHSWADSSALSSQDSVRQRLAKFKECIEAAGVQFRVKLHPMDADRFEDFAQWRISTHDLQEAGITLYSFLGGAAGLISDYSGVWVEYLTCDRPVLLFCPDVESYASGRGFKDPNMLEIASGLITSEASDVREFFQSIRAGQDWRPEVRRTVRGTLEPVPPGRIGERLMEAVSVAARGKNLDLGLSDDEMRR